MLSHACARCGKQLDRSTRSYSGALRMWIAACPRCGHAVRWNPRAARAPFRLWARTRALNIRLGVALAAGQLAGVLLMPYGGVIGEDAAMFDRLFTSFATLPPYPLTFLLLFGSTIAGAAAVSTVAFAPHRGLATRLACAWLLGVLPIPVAILAMAVPLQTAEFLSSLAHIDRTLGLGRYAILLSFPIAMSVVIAVILGFGLRRLASRATLRHARIQAERLRGLHRALTPARHTVPGTH